MSRFAVYGAAADGAMAGSQSLVIEEPAIELVDPAGTLLATSIEADALGDAIHWGADIDTVELDPDRSLSRTATLVVPGSAGLTGSAADRLLDPDSGNRIRVRAGVNGVRWPLATFLLNRTETGYVRGVVAHRLELADPGKQLQDQIVDPFPWDEGETIEAVVARLLGLVVDDAEVAATGYAMPARGSFAPGRRIDDLAQNLLGSAGHELSVNADGTVITQPVPPTTEGAESERWHYGTAGGGLPVPAVTKVRTSRTPQGVLVTGGSLLTASATFGLQVWDTDPASRGYYRGGPAVPLEEIDYPMAAGPGQLAVAGYGRLRRIGSGPAEVVIDVAPNPAMRPGDMLQLDVDEVGDRRLYRVRSIPSMPTRANRLQRVQCRAIWDPALDYTYPADPAEGCITSASDPFDRPDENLEDLEDSPGSPRWTELAWSWAVVGNKAIQRNVRWSLAIWNQGFCSSSQRAYGQVSSVPTGKSIGVAVRSSGQFDCYAALVNSSGRVTLEVWQAGQKIAELGSYDAGSDITGKSISLSAVGSDLVAYWNGVAVITASDTRRTGPFVGMLAYGGNQGDGTAPALDSWSAETVL